MALNSIMKLQTIFISVSLMLMSCGTEPENVHGCLDSQACNYDSTATIDNNSCLYLDCNDECGGASVLDECGQCGGDNECLDVCGMPNGDNSSCFADTNNDGIIDIIDIVAYLNYILLDYDVYYDINNDGAFDAGDIIMIVRYLIGCGDRESASYYTYNDNGGEVFLTADGSVYGIQIELLHSIDFSIGITDRVFIGEYYTENGSSKIIIIDYNGIDNEIIDVLFSYYNEPINITRIVAYDCNAIPIPLLDSNEQ